MSQSLQQSFLVFFSIVFALGEVEDSLLPPEEIRIAYKNTSGYSCFYSFKIFLLQLIHNAAIMQRKLLSEM